MASFVRVLDCPFGQRPQRGQSPVGHGGTFVRLFIPQALESALSGLKAALSGIKSALSGLESSLSGLVPQDFVPFGPLPCFLPLQFTL